MRERGEEVRGGEGRVYVCSAVEQKETIRRRKRQGGRVKAGVGCTGEYTAAEGEYSMVVLCFGQSKTVLGTLNIFQGGGGANLVLSVPPFGRFFGELLRSVFSFDDAVPIGDSELNWTGRKLISPRHMQVQQQMPPE